MTLQEIKRADAIGIAVREFVDAVTSQPLCKKHLLKYSWLSGSSTIVYPIEIYSKGGGNFSVTFQWDSRKKVYGKFIQKMVKMGAPIVDSGYFVPNDGSCPAEIIFELSSKERNEKGEQE